MALDMPVARIKIGRVIRISPQAIPWDVHRDNAAGHLCPYCWVPMASRTHPWRAPTWDHVVPTSRGGPDNRANMIVACRRCNQDKSDRNPIEWLGVLRYRKDDRAPKVQRFVEIIGLHWSDEDRAAAEAIADRWMRQLAAQQEHIAGTLLRTLTEQKPGVPHFSVVPPTHTATLDRICAIMSEHGIERRLWSFSPPHLVRLTVAGKGSTVQIVYDGDDEFRRALAFILTESATRLEAAE